MRKRKRGFSTTLHEQSSLEQIAGNGLLHRRALLSGSVFNDRGLALPDADVTIAPEAAQTTKTKPIEAVSDARGEFVVRVPPGPASYIVAVHAKGYQSQRKSVAINDQERVEVTFQLERESK